MRPAVLLRLQSIVFFQQLYVRSGLFSGAKGNILPFNISIRNFIEVPVGIIAVRFAVDNLKISCYSVRGKKKTFYFAEIFPQVIRSPKRFWKG
jgi:hypothetical protein